jgi:hypothetical protein
MIFGKPEQKGKPAAAGTPMPSAATLPSAAAAPKPSPVAATPAPALSAPSPAAAPAPGSAPPAAGSAAGPRERQAATIRYVDRPEIVETFADSITGLVFDGQTLRIEYGVTRVDEVKPDTAITGRRYPTSRIVLSPGAAIELINRMQQIGAALTQAGAAKATPGRGQKPPSS